MRNVSNGGRWWDSGSRNSGRWEVVKLKEEDVARYLYISTLSDDSEC